MKPTKYRSNKFDLNHSSLEKIKEVRAERGAMSHRVILEKSNAKDIEPQQSSTIINDTSYLAESKRYPSIAVADPVKYLNNSMKKIKRSRS